MIGDVSQLFGFYQFVGRLRKKEYQSIWHKVNPSPLLNQSANELKETGT